jgi:hypothetical protein
MKRFDKLNFIVFLTPTERGYSSNFTFKTCAGHKCKRLWHSDKCIFKQGWKFAPVQHKYQHLILDFTEMDVISYDAKHESQLKQKPISGNAVKFKGKYEWQCDKTMNN